VGTAICLRKRATERRSSYKNALALDPRFGEAHYKKKLARSVGAAARCLRRRRNSSGLRNLLPMTQGTTRCGTIAPARARSPTREAPGKVIEKDPNKNGSADPAGNVRGLKE